MNKKLSISIAAIATSVLIAGGVANAAPNDRTSIPGNEPRQGTTARPRTRQHPRRQSAKRGRQHHHAGQRWRQSVTTNASTTFYVPGVSSPTIANIKTGDRVSVLLAPKTDASNKAQRIALAVSVLPKPEAVIVGGEVSGVTATSFTLTGRKGNTGTVNTSSAKIIVPGKNSANISDIQNGDRVLVQGAPAGDKAVTANLIVVVPDNRDNIFGGVIASITGNTLVVFTRDGQQLKVDAASAVIFERGNADAAMSDLKIGRPVGVIGSKNADGSVTAQLVGQINLALFGSRNR